MSMNTGRNRASSRSPASVGGPLRVVRDSRRTPIRYSSPSIAWLIADCQLLCSLLIGVRSCSIVSYLPNDSVRSVSEANLWGVIERRILNRPIHLIVAGGDAVKGVAALLRSGEDGCC